jgi:hypothetical protein
MKRSGMSEGGLAQTHRQQLLAAMNLLLAAPFFAHLSPVVDVGEAGDARA